MIFTCLLKKKKNIEIITPYHRHENFFFFFFQEKFEANSTIGFLIPFFPKIKVRIVEKDLILINKSV